jgi:hypothetical protein
MIFSKKSSRHLTVAGPIMRRRPILVVSRRSHVMTDQPDTLTDALDSFEPRSRDATASGGQAFARLLALAEQRNSGQIVRVVHFIAATYNGQAFAFDLFDLRALDIDISDDMLRCLDALRWARADLYTLVPDGDARVRSVIDRWGLQWPDDG